MRRLNLDAKELKTLYEQLGSIEKLAASLGVAYGTARRLLIRSNIPRKLGRPQIRLKDG